MKNRKIRRMLSALMLVFPVGLQSQMPPQPDKLVINSDPTTGAVVTINGQQQPQRTNATFIVSPGTYQIKVVQGSQPAFTCIKDGKNSVPISPGQTVVLTCTPGGWK